VIGVAARDIEAGDYVHSHNLALVDFDRDPAFGLDVRPVDYVPEAERATFMGYVREDGRVGTRNFIGILSSVNCSATVIKRIAAHFTPERLAAFPHVDGVAAFAQTSGCGMSSPSEHFDVLRRTLAGYARHPNLAGVLIVGLGCERNQVAALVDSQGLERGPPLRTMVMQEVGGTRETIEAGIAPWRRCCPRPMPPAPAVPASHLKIGLECGGSDGFSGITANPALGAAMDILVRHGGTAILSETPEIHGVEYMLTRRAVTPEVGQKLLDRWPGGRSTRAGHNAQFNGVVGHGNQAGGLANIFEKSLGSAMKGGTTPLQAVYEYAEPIDPERLRLHGLARLRPGGRHRPDRQRRQPDLLHHRPRLDVRLQAGAHDQAGQQHADVQAPEEDMDINCGAILDGELDVPQMGQRIFEQILRHASGEPTKSERWAWATTSSCPGTWASSAGLSKQAADTAGALPCRRRQRRRGAPGGAEDGRDPQAAGHRRQPSRRRHHHRHRGSGQGRSRRLHAGAGLAGEPRGQSSPLCQAGL
jgi:altronate hydrolase